jgi:hypothetical protein
MTDEEQLDVYRAVIDVIKSRLDKAQTFGARQPKKRAAVNIELSHPYRARTYPHRKLMQLIGDFYRDRILTRDDLQQRELTLPVDKDPQIIKYLFGWQLVTGDDSIDCHSETEARYLSVFVELGLHDVAVPDSDEYLEQIFPDLEYLKRRANEILNEHLETVFDPRTKAQVRRDVYTEISKVKPV